MQTPDRAASPFFVMNTSLDSDYDPLEIGDEVPGLNDGSDSDSEDDDLFDWNNAVVMHARTGRGCGQRRRRWRYQHTNSFELLTGMIMYESIDAFVMHGSFSGHSCSSC